MVEAGRDTLEAGGYKRVKDSRVTDDRFLSLLLLLSSRSVEGSSGMEGPTEVV